MDWYAWGKEAFARAKNDSKPILLSIGYSTCHWCHVMRRESFEDDKTAAFINKNFIPVKVDREERPEVDAYYMGAVQAMTGGGGWPLTVFLTPDLNAFYGGTYFPPEPRHGMPSFRQVLEFVANLWKDRRDEVKQNSQRVLRAMAPDPTLGSSAPTRIALDEGYSNLASSFDPEHGGFGGAPKFPLPGSLGFLLQYHFRTGKDLALKAVVKSLDEMLAGGIRDHVGGGFHRYSTDREWLVPHFEKMLYDNALLVKLYAEAYQVSGDPRYAEVVRETLRWIVTEMKNPDGGFYSAQDADTTEGEGVFYTWTPDELGVALGPRKAGVFGKAFGVTKVGNFEGRSILHLRPGVALDPAEKKDVDDSKGALYKVRLVRPRPKTDTKVLTSWNGLVVSALAISSVVLKEESYAKEAETAADFILRNVSKDGRLFRRYAGGEAALDGTLEDYSFFIQGLIDLFEATSNPRWLTEAVRLAGVMVEDFEDKEAGGFFLSVESVPARVKESYDGPTPSGNSVATLGLIRLAELTGDERFRGAADRALKAFADELDRRPSGHTTMLSALDLAINGVKEIVITSKTLRGADEMKDEAFRTYSPDSVVLVATASTFGELAGLSTLLDGRKPGARPRAYVCQNFACKLPANSVEELRAQLSR